MAIAAACVVFDPDRDRLPDHRPADSMMSWLPQPKLQIGLLILLPFLSPRSCRGAGAVPPSAARHTVLAPVGHLPRHGRGRRDIPG
jgi:hypothetical protein